jgi:hypothetical protein
MSRPEGPGYHLILVWVTIDIDDDALAEASELLGTKTKRTRSTPRCARLPGGYAGPRRSRGWPRSAIPARSTNF